MSKCGGEIGFRNRQIDMRAKGKKFYKVSVMLKIRRFCTS